MGYYGNLVQDIKGSFVSPRKVYKSLRDSPSYTDKGYRFVYNLGSLDATFGSDTSFIRNMGYTGLQATRDIAAFKKFSQGAGGGNVLRRIIYNVGGRFVGSLASRVLPRGLGGLAGRYVNITAGRFSQARLKRMESTARQVLFGEFKLDARKVDKVVKDAARQNRIGLEKVQRAIQAVAISDAPDYYKLERLNRKSSANLEYNDEGIMAAISLQEYDSEAIDRMMSTGDIADIMGANAVKDNKEIFTVMSVDSRTPEGALLMKPTQFTDRSQAQQFAKRHGQNVMVTPPDVEKVLSQMDGATYAFGEISTKTREDLVVLLTNILNSPILSEDMLIDSADSGAFGMGAMGLIQGEKNDRVKHAANHLLNKFAKDGIPPDEIGKMANASRYIRGDMTELFGRPTFQKVRVDTSSPFLDEFDRDGNFVKRHGPGPERINYLEQSREVVDRQTSYIQEFDLATGEAKREMVSYGRKVETRNTGKRSRTQTGPGFFQGSEIGYKKTGQKTYVHDGKTHTSQSSSNPQRHNFIPTRMQIQRSIHAQDPDFSGEATVEYNIAFGGRSPQSKSSDFIRDAYQIEMGGPATDRGGRMNNRTDMFVYTPSLLMYNAGLKVANAYGLGISGARKPSGVLDTGMGIGEKLAGKKGGNDAFIHAKGYRANNQQEKIMQELFLKSRKDRLGNPLIKDGRIVLDKNEVLRSKVAASDLELLSETLDDLMFGGADKRFRRMERRPFDRLDTAGKNSRRDIQAAQQRARLQSDFAFDGDDAPAEFEDLFDLRIGESSLDEPDSSLYDFSVLVDDRGERRYEITGYKKVRGRSVGYGTARGQGIVSSDSYDLGGTNPYDDLRLLSDKDPDSEDFMDVLGAASITRQLQHEKIDFNLEQAIHRNMINNGADKMQADILSKAASVRLLKHIKGEGIDGPAGSAMRMLGMDLSPSELAVIIELHGKAQAEIAKNIRRYGIYSHRFDKGRSKGSEPIVLPRASRQEMIMDAEMGSRGNAIFFDEEGLLEALTPSGVEGIIREYKKGKITSQKMYFLIQKKLDTNVSRYVRGMQQRNAAGGPINIPDVSGQKPKATPGTRYGSTRPSRFGGTQNLNARTAARRDTKNFNLAIARYEDQKRFVQRQIELAADVEGTGFMSFILDKVALDSNVRRAFEAVIIREVFGEGDVQVSRTGGISRRQVTNEDIRNFIANRARSFEGPLGFTETPDEDSTLFE